MILLILLVLIILCLLGIQQTLKTGFNELVRGLQAIDERLEERP